MVDRNRKTMAGVTYREAMKITESLDERLVEFLSGWINEQRANPRMSDELAHSFIANVLIENGFLGFFCAAHGSDALMTKLKAIKNETLIVIAKAVQADVEQNNKREAGD